MRLLIVGNPAPFHVGHHFDGAARQMQWLCSVLDPSRAFAAGLWQKLMWRIDRLPARLAAFESEVLTEVQRSKPDLVLTTGIAPLRKGLLDQITASGCVTANFSTDDPWNRHHRCRWFMRALPSYHYVFSPRQANLSQFQSVCSAGSSTVNSLHFGYNPEVHYVEPDVEPGSGCDVLIVGGADTDRVPYVKALIAAGLRVTAYGSYWSRAGVSGLTIAGHADVATLRRATRSAKVNLILVRRANRDGHVMRTYEAWASGGCLLVEDTADHRNIFGSEGTGVLYFRSPADAVSQAVKLKDSAGLRRELLHNLESRLGLESNTYNRRLEVISQVMSPGKPLPDKRRIAGQRG